jgi:HEAT repeats
MDDTRLASLLQQANSASWEARAEAASGLAAMLDSDRAARAMLGLLCDAENTAVGEAALRALLRRPEPLAADLIFEAVASATEDAADHLLYFIHREDPCEPPRQRLVDSARDRAIGSFGLIQEGAREVLSEIGGDATA